MTMKELADSHDRSTPDFYIEEWNTCMIVIPPMSTQMVAENYESLLKFESNLAMINMHETKILIRRQ